MVSASTKSYWLLQIELFSSSIVIFFSNRVFFHGHWRLAGQQGKWGDHLLFHSNTSTRSRTLRHFATLHVRWQSHISNLTADIYQAATRWDLPPYPITVWLIDDVMLIFVCVLVDLIQGFCHSYVILNSHRLSFLYYKRTDYPSMLATTFHEVILVTATRNRKSGNTGCHNRNL